ncbi:hypothetical protein [Serinicoccus marinus]|uniref:hypothetical protein n=1 Tax=Serinicoccus marinus TaxID=247333 RepID=UPI0003B5EBAA|nr:hypothetical protein [Serinicoccus marinus]
MSYDITLCPRDAGQSWEDALAAADAEDSGREADEQALTEGVETFRRIETRLREVLSGELETWVAEETGGDVYGELTAPRTGIQVELFDGSAAVSLGEREPGEEPSEDSGPDRAQVLEEARRAVGIVAAETGYQPFDHQTEEPFDGTFREGAPGAEPAEATAGQTGIARPSAAEIARRDPSSLRRRGWVYLVLGVAITVFAANRLASGESGVLTIMLLVIGILDLLGGLFLLSVGRRAAEDERIRLGGPEESGSGPDAAGTTPG